MLESDWLNTSYLSEILKVHRTLLGLLARFFIAQYLFFLPAYLWSDRDYYER